jgi:hypothetical protein
MRGFLAGSLTLVVLYTLLRPNAAGAVQSGSNIALAGFKRLLSGDVAGVPLRKGLQPTIANNPTTPTSPGRQLPAASTDTTPATPAPRGLTNV